MPFPFIRNNPLLNHLLRSLHVLVDLFGVAAAVRFQVKEVVMEFLTLYESALGVHLGTHDRRDSPWRYDRADEVA